MKKYKTEFSKEELHATLHSNDAEATDIIEDADKWEAFKDKFNDFIKKGKKIPVLGGVIDDIVTMVDLVDSYVKKEYSGIPLGTIISIVAVLIYVISPIDLIPDAIPFVGYLDDVAVVLFALGFGIDKDLDKYRRWQEENRRKAIASFEEILAEEISNVINHQYLSGVIITDDMKIKLLLADSSEDVFPIECVVKIANVPVKALEEYDVIETNDIVEVIGETVALDVIKWVEGIDKKAYYEPDFDARWDDYIIQEGDD